MDAKPWDTRTDNPAIIEAKSKIRDVIEDAREKLDPVVRAEADAARNELLLQELAKKPGARVALYLSIPPEPDTHALAEVLRAQAPVLVPILTKGPFKDGFREVGWAWWQQEELIFGAWDIPEPVAERLPPEVLGEVDVILVSGLAGTKSGDRLGVGGGWYDRALPYAKPTAERWMLLNDDEIYPELPLEPHDMQVHRIFTPTQQIICADLD